ncbi:MAG: glycine cleavage system aminomethyltransferase GcvT [Kiritimatiellia bacterium]|jgi:aminomethyltransferase|nr:glycine cleavage system aminomethyltransferase GcvT [Kiritimatiellia bacterium]MDP6849146.1 glycine cleavage system aminomethyltransferase GcvT [Kiritimatiellia bacterium]
MTDLKRTPLYSAHTELGARMMPFAGFDMPVQYEGIISEHLATRSAVTIFDTCHMGEIRVTGNSALSSLERIVSCNLTDLPAGRCRYGLMCNEQGGVVDDLLVYRMGDAEFLLVVNAGTKDFDLSWIRRHADDTTCVTDETDETAKLDIQGPGSVRVMGRLMENPVADMKYYAWKTNRFNGRDVLVSRTGYTGEMGFEVYCGPDAALDIWNSALEEGVVPAGLGARDTLRLEAGLPLYGHELSADRNAAESGLHRAISKEKNFIGSEAVNSGAPSFELTGLELEGRRTARAKDLVTGPSGEEIGVVTSGSFCPSVKKALALAYVKAGATRRGEVLSIQTARQVLQVSLVDRPFYKDGTVRRPASEFI